MKKIALMIVTLAIILGANAFAGVTFIVDSPQHTSKSSSPHPYNTNPSNNNNIGNTNSTQCIQAGYTKTSCPQGKYAVERCSYNSSYFKYCCTNAYSNNPSQCE